MESPSRPQTPSHYPLYGVRMSTTAIQTLIGEIYPDANIISTSQLPSGLSFNNRIYHVRLDHGRPPDSTTPDRAFSGAHDLVLKLNGRFFGPDKIQNEVACLRLMELHCPEVPAPRVQAWSDDGQRFVRVCQSGDDCENGRAPEVMPDDHSGGWILMSRVHGESLVPEDWDEQTMETLVHQLADMMACWRRKIPAIKHSANLLFCDPDSANLLLTRKSEAGSFPGAMARGLIGVPAEATARTNLASSLAGYYRMRLESSLYEVETNQVHAPNRHLVPIVQRFVSETLPRLTLGLITEENGQNAFVFTHRDVSPRNILVSGNPPKITGIVDYEFSGFFPETEEFVQSHVGNAGDWPHDAHRAFLERLGQLGVNTPLSGINETIWERTLSLDRLIENVAPWWLPGDRTGDVLRDAFREAEDTVRREIRVLEGSF